MLAEAIITSTIVLTTLVGLYANFMKLYNVYKIRDTYYDIDGVYAIKNAIDAMIDDGSLAGTLALNTNNYKLIINNNCIFLNQESYCNFCIVSNNMSYCNFLKKTYSIENMYVVKYNENSINELKKVVNLKTFKDYLNYIEKYYNFNMDEDNKYSYLFVVEYKKNDKYYYSSLGVR